MFSRFFYAINIGALFFIPIFGFSEVFTTDETIVVVVTGAKVEQNIDETVEPVEVIQKEDIQQMGAKNLKEVLEHIPGLIVYDHPLSTVMMQGFEGAYVKILVDGVEITGDVAGATPIGQLPVVDIERIEIVRGASSVLYGSDAMGGVINIITRKASKQGFSGNLQAEIATNYRLYSAGSLFYRNNTFSLSVQGSYDYDEGKQIKVKNNLGQGVSIYDVPLTFLSTLRSEGSWISSDGELAIFGNWGKSEKKTSTSVDGGAAFFDTKLEGGIKGKKAFSQLITFDGFFTYKTYLHDVDQLNYTFSTTTKSSSYFADVEGELRLSWDVSLEHGILLGFNGKREQIEGDSFDSPKAATFLSVFFQDTWNVNGLDTFRLVPGIRFDVRPPEENGEQFLYKLSPKLSFRWDVLDNLVYRFSYGMGYKTPSLKQNYWLFFHPAPENFMLIGNPSLNPETSHGFNTSLTYRPTTDVTIEINAYFNYVYDLIDSVIIDENDGVYTTLTGVNKNYIYVRTYRNIGEAITTGTDFSFNYITKQFSSSFTYVLSVAKEKNNTGFVDLPSRVPHQIKATISYQIPVLDVSASVRGSWNAPQLINESTKTYSPDLLLINGQISKKIFKDRIELYGGIKNLFNNFHFIPGSDGKSQRDYFGLKDGMVFYVGALYQW